MRVALAQVNATVGDFEGNAKKILAAAAAARDAGADVVALPEMAVTGYPPRDLLERRAFVAAAVEATERIARGLPLPALLGTVRPNEGPGRPLKNAAALCRGGRIEAWAEKCLLPTYDVFDEDRYFEPGRPAAPWEVAGRRLGVTICEDVWTGTALPVRRHHDDPVAATVAEGADVILNVSASPFEKGKPAARRALLADHARRHGRPVLFTNMVGGNDDLVFDGEALSVSAAGEVAAAGRPFEEDLLVVDPDAPGAAAPPPLEDVEAVRRALVLGTRDYVAKCGFKRVAVALSGGIDSSLVAAVAAEAVGARNVLGVSLPTRYSSPGSRTDAAALAARLGIDFRTIEIDPVFEAFLRALAPAFEGKKPDVTEENLQSRVRGAVMMALSNKTGRLVLTTGNKSETAVGYCTLYGDTAGGLAVIADVPKTLVYAVADLYREAIPPDVFTKPPSAELRPGQRDQDSLPPYGLLDSVLEAYVEEGLSPEEIRARGVDPAVVSKVVGLVEGSEWKRRQVAPGLRVTTKAFGTGRRVPIAKRWP